VMYECLTSGGGPIPAPPAPVPISTGFFVQVLADAPAGLRLRSQPTTESATLAIEPPLTRLEIIQAGDQAKIGKANQWLRVRDEQGLEGCVAAWFVEPAAALPSVPATGPAPSP